MSHKPLTHSSSTRVNSDGLIRQIVSFSFCLFISQFEGFTETFEDIILVVQLRKKKKKFAHTYHSTQCYFLRTI